MIFTTLIACAITLTASIAGQSPQSATPPATGNKASTDKPPVEILSHKIGPESYPMLDSRSSIASPTAAENGDIPRLPNQPSPGERTPEERRRQGRIHPSSSPRGAYSPNLFQLVIKNTGAKSIKVIEWDFLFTHCENGQFVPRYGMTTTVHIKPGGKKTLKRVMPPITGRCDMPRAIIDELRKQERVSIKRIEYVDGSVWQRQ